MEFKGHTTSTMFFSPLTGKNLGRNWNSSDLLETSGKNGYYILTIAPNFSGNHLIGRCQGLFPPMPSSAEKSPWNEVGETLLSRSAKNSPQQGRFPREIALEAKQVLVFVWFISNLEATRSVSDKKEGPYQAPKAHSLRTGTFAKPSFITFVASRSKAI